MVLIAIGLTLIYSNILRVLLGNQKSLNEYTDKNST